MSRIQNVVTASHAATQYAARWWAAHIFFAVNYGIWDRNTAPLEIETSEGIIDLSRGGIISRTTSGSTMSGSGSQRKPQKENTVARVHVDRGGDTRGGVIKATEHWNRLTTDGVLHFEAKINLAQYEWRDFINDEIRCPSWIAAVISKYTGRPPRYGVLEGAICLTRNPDYKSDYWDGARHERDWICEPDLEDRDHAAQLSGFMKLQHLLPSGCLVLTEHLDAESFREEIDALENA